MPDHPNKVFIKKMNDLSAESKKRLNKTIDEILDKYKGTKKQIANLKILSNILLLEESISEQVNLYIKSDEKETNKILDKIEKTIQKKQDLYKKILYSNKE